MSARRPLLTAASAGALLCALWFVPSAHATGDQRTGGAPAHQGQRHTAALPATAGRADTTGYVVGGSLFLGLGAASVVYARRTHTG
ncbi:hypothetical protein ACIPW9_05705 [Streptomyces sp. NPDC090052]|uniref:hypothetical protein n=1 Tax=unclassified Streptomyces TaxID=2593676 RepID=UPI002255699B|nr:MULTISPECIES: hypothetical protein [unclassified Streptomyces]MCX4724219.1 hypothetical protein [Streptomyces sp. NBC_01306]WSV06245.1 hypothetical protein OG372_23280 [Streptomyces sp. NBC_01020]WSX44372.1 hypothetical protein OG760_23265 [Streptomyces sp. NBC_00963]WSX67621.1 hypothetical protein OG221_13865 [Streptomyces sp. NBC_00932]